MLEDNALGKLKHATRYLGAWPKYNGSTDLVVTKRCKAAQEAYYAFGEAWRTSVPMREKAMIFKGQVINTLLSGLEAEVLRVCDYEKLEKCMLGLARELCGLRGTYSQRDHRRIKTNVDIRTMVGITAVHNELRVRRLEWLSSILEQPTENKQHVLR